MVVQGITPMNCMQPIHVHFYIEFPALLTVILEAIEYC